WLGELADYSTINKYGESRYSHSSSTNRYSSSHKRGRNSHRYSHYRPKEPALVPLYQPSTPFGFRPVIRCRKTRRWTGFN
ncbi:hypothetical protein, partial [Bacteroides caecimuris]|uniref:hypothetical protein n=1 Tax=Bacteroides caecimuris TaxID=1796613 RepID=UPI00265DFD17